MKIRSVTLFAPAEPTAASAVEAFGPVLGRLAARFADAGYEVQTTRIGLPPLAALGATPRGLVQLVRELEQAAAQGGAGYVALGPLRFAELEQGEAVAGALADGLAATGVVFGTIETADESSVDFAAVRAAAEVIRVLAETTAGGFGNLRFAALANCPPGVPFFPAAYHDGAEPWFGLALQAADLAVEAFGAAESLVRAERELTARLDRELGWLEAVAIRAEAEFGIRYAGVDPTLAPFPDDRESIGAALERLGVGRFGSAGTLTGAALVTRAVRATGARRCGFAGLMLPVLEDSVLARSAAEGLYGWEELLLYSAVCGLGLDTVPLPGDIGAEELAAIVADVSTLAVTLGKPLTCRLFPVPGKRSGDHTSFDFPYFANGGVLPAKGLGSPALLRRGRAGGPP